MTNKVDRQTMFKTLKEFNNSQDLTISVIPSNLVQTVWDPIETLLNNIKQRAPDEIDPALVYNNMMNGKMLLVVISDSDRIIAFNGIDVRTTDTGLRYLMIPLTSGSRLDEWMPTFLDLAKHIALEQDCVELRGMAVRPGWMKKLKQFGWTEVHTTIKCKI